MILNENTTKVQQMLANIKTPIKVLKLSSVKVMKTASHELQPLYSFNYATLETMVTCQ